MTVTVVKTKAKAKSSAKSELDIKVERLITIKRQLDEVKDITTEYDKLRKELSSYADSTGEPSDQVVFTTPLGVVTLTPKAVERKISDMSKLATLLGDDVFKSIATVTMANVDKYLSATEKDTCVTSGQTGARKITVSYS